MFVCPYIIFYSQYTDDNFNFIKAIVCTVEPSQFKFVNIGSDLVIAPICVYPIFSTYLYDNKKIVPMWSSTLN